MKISILLLLVIIITTIITTIKSQEQKEQQHEQQQQQEEQGNTPSRNRIQNKIEEAVIKAREEAIDNEFSIADRDEDNVLTRSEFGEYLTLHDGFHGKRASSSSLSSLSSTNSILGSINLHHFDTRSDISDEFKGDFDDVHAKTISFWTALLNSVLMIVVTEIGDRTWFLAAVMAMKHPRLIVYSGAMGALFLMTILSAAIGFTLPKLLPKFYTHYASVVLFGYFSYKFLSEAWVFFFSFFFIEDITSPNKTPTPPPPPPPQKKQLRNVQSPPKKE